MALYTSFYTRQLALRPEALGGGGVEQEGEKTHQKTVARRTVDYAGPYVTWFERRYQIRSPADTPALPPVAAGALQLLPPLAYTHQPASSFNIKFAGQAPSKTRSSINAAVWTPDGRRCLTGTQAGEFTMWGGTSFQFETIIQSHETPVRTMVFTHNGNFLLSGDDAGTVRYWKPNLELVKSVGAHREAVRQLAAAPSDLKYATASDDSTVRVWDFARVATEAVLAGHGGDVKCVDWHPHKALLASGSKDGLVKLWCPKTGRCLSTLHGHQGTVMQCQWNTNGNWVLTASRDQTCKVYDIRMQRELSSFRGHNRDVTYAAWHPFQEELFVSGGHDGSMLFWLASRQAPQAEVRAAHEGSIWAAAWHPAGHLLATGAGDYAVKFWCRCRPGDPFIEQQQEEQAELAALAAEAQPVTAPRPAALLAPAPTFGSGPPGGAIPGIGDAVAMPVLPAASVDVFGARQQPYDAEGRGGHAPADGPLAQQRPGGDGEGARRGRAGAGAERKRNRRGSRSPLPEEAAAARKPRRHAEPFPREDEPAAGSAHRAFIAIPRRRPPPAAAGGPPYGQRGGPPPFEGHRGGGPPPPMGHQQPPQAYPPPHPHHQPQQGPPWPMQQQQPHGMPPPVAFDPRRGPPPPWAGGRGGPPPWQGDGRGRGRGRW